MHKLCGVLPEAVARSTKQSFEAFGRCETAHAVRNAFVPVTEAAAFGEVWGTNGMHGSPGNGNQACDRLVLFLAAAPEGTALYDGSTQTNGALIMGIYHGVFSLTTMQYIVETELVDGMPVSGHMNSDLPVEVKELASIHVPVKTLRHRGAFVDQSDFWTEIVKMVHITIHLGADLPPHYRGQGNEQSRRVDGEDRLLVRTICEDAHAVLTDPNEVTRLQRIAAMDAKYRRQGGPRSRACKNSRSRPHNLDGWNVLAKVWQLAEHNHEVHVDRWVAEANGSREQSTGAR